MAIALVQHGFNSPKFPSLTSVTFAFAAPNTAGDLIVVCVGHNTLGVSVSSITDSSGNTYTALGGINSATTLGTFYYFAPNITSGSNTVTVTFSGACAFPDIMVSEWSGLMTSVGVAEGTTTFGVGATGTTTAISSGAYTTTNGNDLLINACFTTQVISGGGAGWTQIDLTDDGDYHGYQTTGATGAFTATATQGSTGEWTARLLAFKAQPGGIGQGTVSIAGHANMTCSVKLTHNGRVSLLGRAVATPRVTKADDAIILI